MTKRQITARIPKTILDSLKSEAERRGVSLSKVIEEKLDELSQYKNDGVK